MRQIYCNHKYISYKAWTPSNDDNSGVVLLSELCLPSKLLFLLTLNVIKERVIKYIFKFFVFLALYQPHTKLGCGKESYNNNSCSIMCQSASHRQPSIKCNILFPSLVFDRSPSILIVYRVLKEETFIYLYILQNSSCWMKVHLILLLLFFLVCNSHRVKIFLQRLGKRENNNIMWTSRENKSQYICMAGQNGGGETKKKKGRREFKIQRPAVRF